ncbi:unnamed protein product, partial [Meganyctiphanes norvegica]
TLSLPCAYHYSLKRNLVHTAKMLSTRSVLMLLTVFLAVAAVSDALTLCPQFPSCCLGNTCHALCPSCREARRFRGGKALHPKYLYGTSGGFLINQGSDGNFVLGPFSNFR